MEPSTDSKRLLSSASEATAELPKVLSAVMDVATAMSSATLAEFCCDAGLAHRLVMWLGSLLLFFASHLEKVGAKHQKNQH